MEVEAQPLLIEDDEKLCCPMETQRSKKLSRLRSWVVAITTHTVVALLVLVAAVPLLKVDVSSSTKLGDSKARPMLYCMSVQLPMILGLLLTKNLAPLKPVIKYTIDHPPADSWSNPLYFGPPSNESEIAWNKLTRRK